MIVTSRPDADIKTHLRLIKPREIEKKDEKQREDLRLFARKRIVEGTSLKELSEKEQSEFRYRNGFVVEFIREKE